MALATCIAVGYALEAGDVSPSAGKIESKVIALANGEKFQGYSSGSGSLWEFDNSDLSGGVIVRKSAQTNSSVNVPVGKDTNTSTSKFLKSIKAAFALNNEELSKVLLSSRKTVHNWMNEGAIPNKSKMGRILDINDIAQAWNINGFDKKPELVHERAQGDLTILDMLMRKELDKELILFSASGISLTHTPVNSLEDPFA